MKKIRDFMRPQRLVTVTEDDDLALAAQILLWHRARYLPVMRGEKVVGVLSEHDLLARQAEIGPAAMGQMKVRSAMSLPVQLAHPDDAATVTARRMVRNGIGCLPVVEDGLLVGLVTRADILHLVGTPPAFAGLRLTARDVMTREPVTGMADDLLVDMASRMEASGVRHLPIIDAQGHLVGMLSDRDVRGAFGAPWQVDTVRALSLRVAHAMSRQPAAAREDAPLSELATRFVDLQVGALVVVDAAERVVGIVSYVDVLKALLRSY